jgi:hypothetical protein
MLALLGLIPQILGLGSSITDLFKMKAKAESDKQLREIDKEIEAVRDKRAVLVAEAGNVMSATINSSIRGLMGLSVAAILMNMAWDKIAGKIAGCTYKVMPEYCHYFKTDPFSEWEIAAITTIICFYFVAEKFGKK